MMNTISFYALKRIAFLTSAFLALKIFMLLTSAESLASPSISGGVWFNYRYVQDDNRDEETLGDMADEALIIYIDDKAETQPWSLSAEVRLGPGSFTDTANNSSGDTITFHKAWIGWQANKNNTLLIGKSTVPFGWNTVNFWPGGMLFGGYEDQMDVGIQLQGRYDNWLYDAAYFHADDWGETSTDTTDDNGHWGSSTTFRKVQTFVGNIGYQTNKRHTFGLALQSGKLQDLTNINDDNPISGSHSGAVAYYHGTFNEIHLKAQAMTITRDLPSDYASLINTTNTIKNTRAGIELGYKFTPWFFYINATAANTSTEGNNSDQIHAFAPGLSYDYGPGWLYFEYLQQDGFINRESMIGEGDFEAFYITMDYYF